MHLLYPSLLFIVTERKTLSIRLWMDVSKGRNLYTTHRHRKEMAFLHKKRETCTDSDKGPSPLPSINVTHVSLNCYLLLFYSRVPFFYHKNYFCALLATRAFFLASMRVYSSASARKVRRSFFSKASSIWPNNACFF